MRILQRVYKSAKNPRFCAACHSFTTQFPGGAEIVLTMLFVDVRGSTPLAEKMHAAELTALGDNVNITARLASKAGAGEVLASEAMCDAARIETGRLEKRDLELKGKSELVSVRVLHPG